MATPVAQLAEFRLVISGQKGDYSARWTDSDGQESGSFLLIPPLDKKITDNLRWYLEEFYRFPGAGDRKRALEIEKELNAWGDALFKALFSGNEGTHVYRNIMDAADKKRPCMLTIGSVEPDILVQPWEMMRNEKGPLAFQGITIRRQLTGAGKTERHRFGLPLRVLLIVSRPKKVGFIDPRNSIRPLFDALDILGPDKVDINFCNPPTLGRLEEMISEARKDRQPYHIVHFDGHGTYLPKTGIGALCFEDNDTKNDLISGPRLGGLLARLNVPLAILEACRGADLSDRPVFGSLAPALLQSGVGSVIAFSHSVHIEASRLFVERFYRELAAEMSVGQALQEARAHMFANTARPLHSGPRPEKVNVHDWFIPQLYQVGADPALVIKSGKKGKRGGAPQAAKSWRQEDMKSFPDPPMYQFHGRAMELLKLERAFLKHPAIVLTGGGGMGKTALAREAADWWLRIRLFHRAVFCSFERRTGAEQVVAAIGRCLEGDDFGSRTADDQWQTAVKLFHEHKVLVVWDNFESTLPMYQRGEDDDAGESALSFGREARARLNRLYRDLTGNSPAGRLLVTCRPENTGLPGISERPLTGLEHYDSLNLLSAIMDIKGISVERPGYDRSEIDALLKMIDYHPLSIELVTPHLKELTPKTIREEFRGNLDKFITGDADQKRNSSLLASLEFSKKRLSGSARKVLPYLAWFEGGVFEDNLLDLIQMKAKKWAKIRNELVDTALVAVEDDFLLNKRPYLRFHPTLPYAADADGVPGRDETEKRFIGIYLNVMRAVDEAFQGSEPANGMALIGREEANFRSAIRCAYARGARQAGWAMADTLRLFLERSGRLRERDALVQWMRDQTGEADVLDSAACASIRHHAWTRFTQGNADEAVQAVNGLIARLEKEGLAEGSDPAFELAMSYNYQGRIFYSAGRADLAIAPLDKAVALWKKLGDDQRGNLSMALGHRANALMTLGKYDDALKAAQECLAIARDLGHDRNIAAGLDQIASILTEQKRYAESDDKYGEALEAAEKAGDLGLQGSILQHQGGLQNHLGQHDRAVELYKKAIEMFKRSGDRGSEMRSCALIATAEADRDQFDSSEAWYKRSRELAVELKDNRQLAGIAQNVGILYQMRAEKTDDPTQHTNLLHQAVKSVEESLKIELKMNNEVSAASSYGQLSVLYFGLGDLDPAEENATKALAIHTELNHPDVYKEYNTLAKIARARGDEKTAAEWQTKCDAKVEKLARLAARGKKEGPPAEPPEELIKMILALAQAAYHARSTKSALPPEAAEVIAQMAEAPPPFPAVGSFIKAVADGREDLAVPPGLPAKIREILKALAAAVKES